MKKLLSIVLAVVALTAFAKINGSLKFIPAKVDGIICVDSARGMNNSAVSNAFKSNIDFNAEMDKLNTKLKVYGLKASDIFQDITLFISARDTFGAIITTKMKNAQLKKMIANGFFKELDPTFELKESKSGNTTLYSFSTSYLSEMISKAPGSSNISIPENMSFSYVDSNHVLFTKSADIVKILASMKAGNLAGNKSFTSKLKDVNTDAILWLLFDTPDKAGSQPDDQQEGVDLIGGSVDITGKQNDININGFVRCKSSQMAMQYAQQAQFFIMMFGGSIFKGDQQLAMDVTKAIKIKNQANDIKLNMVIPEGMQTKLKAFAEKTAKEQAQALQGDGNLPIQPAPGGEQSVKH